MKKTKFIALVLVVAIGLMGAGYAAWTQSFNVNTTIRTGDLKVVLDNEVKAEFYANFKNESFRKLEDNVYQDAASAVGNVATFSIYNMYPGSEFKTALTAKNEGTLPAVFNAVTVTVKDKSGATITSGDLYNAIKVDYNFSIVNAVTKVVRPDEISRSDVALKDLQGYLTRSLVGKYLLASEVLKNTGSLDYTMTFKIPEDGLNTVNGVNIGAQDNLKVEIRFDFVQHNMFPTPTKIGLQ